MNPEIPSAGVIVTDFSKTEIKKLSAMQIFTKGKQPRILVVGIVVEHVSSE